MKAHIFAHNRFNNKEHYLLRHFKFSLVGRLALLILGKERVWNMLFDAFDVGFGAGTDYRDIHGRNL